MNKPGSLTLHPRVLRTVAWPLGIVSILAIIYAYRFDKIAPTTTWNRFHECATGAIRPHPSPSSTPSEHDLLDDFFAASDYQKQCAKEYGIEYLSRTAQRRTEFCEDASISSLLCFHAKGIDPLCVARGAQIGATSVNDDSALSISMQCGLRNFTEESAQSENARVELEGIQNVEDIKPYYYNTGAGEQLREWRFITPDNKASTTSECSKDQNDGQWYLLARREGNTNIWHKLMEIWQATLSVNALRLAVDPDTGGPLLTKEQRDSIQVVFEDDREEYLEPVWNMVSGNAPIRRRDLPKPFCPGNVILPLAGSSSPFWTFIVEQTEHEACQTRTLMDFLVPSVLKTFGIEQPRTEIDVHFFPVVTIIDRKETRVFQNLAEHVVLLRQRNPNVTFNVVDFADIPLHEQVRLVQGSDVLVGHHGAGMTHLFWLPPGSAVVEIFPAPRFPIVGFRHVAFMRRLVHFVGHSVWKEQWDAAVAGTPIPADWEPPLYDTKWQGAAASYVLKEDFVGLIEAAIRSQSFKSARVWE